MLTPLKLIYFKSRIRIPGRNCENLQAFEVKTKSLYKTETLKPGQNLPRFYFAPLSVSLRCSCFKKKKCASADFVLKPHNFIVSKSNTLSFETDTK